MPRLPFIGRLYLREYIALVLGFTFVAIEAFIRLVIVFILPQRVIKWFHDRSKSLFLWFIGRGRSSNAHSAPHSDSRRKLDGEAKVIINGAEASGDADAEGRSGPNSVYGSDVEAFTTLDGDEAEDSDESPSVRRRADAIRRAADFGELCAIHGYEYEEHVVQTKDGYLLGLHRLPGRRPAAPPTPTSYASAVSGSSTVNGHLAPPGSYNPQSASRSRANRRLIGQSTGKPVVYLHHGLLMNSEVFLCATSSARCIPLALVDAGYDVWLGNNRGNKYSKKCIHAPPTSSRFWDFSIDEFAWHDIPDAIEYVLRVTGREELSYVGFSQGTAQAFAALSIHPQLNEKVDVFIALAPAMSPPGLSSSIVDGLMKASPSLMFLFFGRKSILSSTVMWQSILYPPIFARLIDSSLRFLFNWHGNNITTLQKIAAYAHLYSFASVKSVVHWFQIMRNAKFQMYDDDVMPPGGGAKSTGGLLLGTAQKAFYTPARFPTRNIATPIVLLYGTKDSLVDISVMKKELPTHTVVRALEGYEHLDILWGKDIHKDVIPEVLGALKVYAGESERS